MSVKLSQLLFLQCLIARVHHVVSTSTSVPIAQFSFTRHSKESNVPGIECPSVWYKYNPITQDCQCIPLESLTCDGEYAYYADISHILTYNANKRVVTEMKMKHQYLTGYNAMDGRHYVLLPNNISELNQYMCGPLNRKDFMCNECKDGYGPAATYESESCASMCYPCKDTWRHLLFHLALSFIPLTVFYLLILVFQVRLTSAPMTCFIMYSQLVVLIFYGECGLNLGNTTVGALKFSYTKGILRRGTKIFLTLYGVFNLDFFHYYYSISILRQQQAKTHSYLLSWLHICILSFSTDTPNMIWFCVELHGRKFGPIVCLWRPFHGCFVRLRRGWNTKSDLIDVFASFFLLSYCKVLYQIMLTITFEEITNYSFTDGRVTHSYVLVTDYSINMFKTNDYFFIFLTFFTTMLTLFFMIFPVFLLLFLSLKDVPKSALNVCF